MPTLAASSLDQMVGRQVRRWMLQEERRSRARPPACVALSRLPGSGAAEVGRRVAEQLGFGFFGIEIVDRIARARRVRRDLVAGLDERVRDAIERFVRDGIHRQAFGESDYHEALMHVLATFAKRGMAVLLGRGSAYALPPERTLRVLVVASQRNRLERLRVARHLSESAARTRLEHEEAQRLQFNRHHFGVDPDDPRLYDLVLNTETLGIPAATELTLQAFRQRFADVHPEESGRPRPPEWPGPAWSQSERVVAGR